MRNSKKLKIAVIVGTRPNFIKLAPLIAALSKSPRFQTKIINTNQHYDRQMSDVFFKELKIKNPDYNLKIKPGTQGQQTGEIIIKLEKIYAKEKFDMVIVIGDVTSTLAGALAAKQLHIKVAHIEAGMRSYNKEMPEEINRTLTDHMSDILLCPTKTAADNLKKENITKNIYVVGDLMHKTLMQNIKLTKKSSILTKLKLKPKKYILLTIHRQSNTDNKTNLSNIIKAIIKSKEPTVFPIHPRTKKLLTKIKIPKTNTLKIIDPLGYIDMLTLEKNAKKILTDSGGIQKEAYWLKIPCITLRDDTEWVETVENKWNILVGTNQNKIIKAIKNFLPPRKQKKYQIDKNTCKKILETLSKI
jgi:UDP-N-acetylglucosamine 2-epimerase (non-hydrolysing)